MASSGDAEKGTRGGKAGKGRRGRVGNARARLLEAAVAAFAEHGYVGARTRDIAARAGVAEKTLFAHFGSKSVLFGEAVGAGLQEFMGDGAMRSLGPSLSGLRSARERLRAIARNRLAFAAANPELVKVGLQELLLDPSFREPFKAYWRDNILPGTRGLIADAMASGHLREQPPERVLRIFVSMIVGYIVTRHVILPELDWDDEAELEAMIEVFLRGVGAERPDPEPDSEPDSEPEPESDP